jgi:hypothetical protein
MTAWSKACDDVCDGHTDILPFDVKTLALAMNKCKKDLALATNMLGTLVRATR